jgi:hypothetical protein
MQVHQLERWVGERTRMQFLSGQRNQAPTVGCETCVAELEGRCRFVRRAGVIAATHMDAADK